MCELRTDPKEKSMGLETLVTRSTPTHVGHSLPAKSRGSPHYLLPLGISRIHFGALASLEAARNKNKANQYLKNPK